MLDKKLTIIGGGLAGCEASYQAAKRGILVTLFEMRPKRTTPAHSTNFLAEIVCSNSFGSLLPDRASGLLIDELSKLDSLLLRIARENSVPAGGSLAVDREKFSNEVTTFLQGYKNVNIVRDEIKEIPETPTIIASGPLTSPALSESIQQLTGLDHLFFFDAIAPIVARDSIDMSVAFRASRFAATNGQTNDYINCPFTQAEYTKFVTALVKAETVKLKSNEEELISGVKTGKGSFFEGCLPVEVIASRGEKSLTFGPMRPIGLTDPRIDQRPYAVLQLRQDNLADSLYNMVGFQTNLKFSEQKRVFQMVPGLKNAEFVRFGQMHRNTFISSPSLLLPTLQTKIRSDLFFAGQIIGVEGYLGNIGTGLLAGINAANYLNGFDLILLPPETMLSSLCRYVTQSNSTNFQPMKANFGILPELDSQLRTRLERAAQHVRNATTSMDEFLWQNKNILFQ